MNQPTEEDFQLWLKEQEKENSLKRLISSLIFDSIRSLPHNLLLFGSSIFDMINAVAEATKAPEDNKKSRK